MQGRRPHVECVLKIIVVEKQEVRRADFVDAICELPGVVVCGATGFVDALRIMSTEPVDAMVLGGLPDAEQQQLLTLVQSLPSCEVIGADDAAELATRIEPLVGRKRKLRTQPLRTAPQRARPGVQTVVLKDWLPAMCAGFAARMPAYVELAPIVSGDTPPVRCVPEVLEHEVLDIVLEAATKLPWGGTIWLTAERSGTDSVRIEVLENGRGTGGDVTLQAARRLAS